MLGDDQHVLVEKQPERGFGIKTISVIVLLYAVLPVAVEEFTAPQWYRHGTFRCFEVERSCVDRS